MKKKLPPLFFAAVITLSFSLAACGIIPDDNNGENPIPDVNTPIKTPDVLAEELKVSLNNYLSSQSFADAVIRSQTTQNRVPMMYTKYIDANFYTRECVNTFKRYLSFSEEVINEEGFIDDSLFTGSAIDEQGWNSLMDYCFSFSLIYNQYKQWLETTDNADTTVEYYASAVCDYLTFLDDWTANECLESDWHGTDTVITKYTLTTYVSNGLNAYGNASSDYNYSKEELKDLTQEIKEVSPNKAAFDGFINDLDRLDGYNGLSSAEQRALRTELREEFLALVPQTGVPFGYGMWNVIPMTAYNLGMTDGTPYCDEKMLAYYEADESGAFIREGGTPNWVGFSGRPMAASLYRSSEKYSAAYEKTMQGYFPFTDGWNQPLDEMINLDRLCSYYNHDLQTGANVSPQYALLTGMMHGIDMEHYKKEVPALELGETGNEVFNVITLWRENLETDGNGNYIISNLTDMAVAIAYIAQTEGINAPTPLGVYNHSEAVIRFEK